MGVLLTSFATRKSTDESAHVQRTKNKRSDSATVRCYCAAASGQQRLLCRSLRKGATASTEEPSRIRSLRTESSSPTTHLQTSGHSTQRRRLHDKEANAYGRKHERHRLHGESANVYGRKNNNHLDVVKVEGSSATGFERVVAVEPSPTGVCQPRQRLVRTKVTASTSVPYLTSSTSTRRKAAAPPALSGWLQ